MSEEQLAVVISDIPFGSAYAYRRGDKIKQDAVDANDWQDYVAAADSKEAREAQGLPEEEDAPAPDAPAATQASATSQPKNIPTTAAGGKDK